MIPFMVSIYGMFQILFLVPISNGTGHITVLSSDQIQKQPFHQEWTNTESI